MLKIPAVCPICGDDTYVESVRCVKCGTSIANKFALGKFDKLTSAQTEFVLAFLGCEGNIKEMEKVLGVSYPTVKARLAEIQNVLGLSRKSKADKQMEILVRIDKGEIDVDKAMELLQKEV